MSKTNYTLKAAANQVREPSRELTEDELVQVSGGTECGATCITQVLQMSHEGKKSIIQNLRA
jgi:hypothetical protein